MSTPSWPHRTSAPVARRASQTLTTSRRRQSVACCPRAEGREINLDLSRSNGCSRILRRCPQLVEVQMATKRSDGHNTSRRVVTADASQFLPFDLVARVKAEHPDWSEQRVEAWIAQEVRR